MTNPQTSLFRCRPIARLRRTFLPALCVATAACSRGGGGGAPPAVLTPQLVASRIEDATADDRLGAGDRLVLRFSTAVRPNGALAADFTLPVAGDSLGSGASVAAGTDPNEIVVTLGIAAQLQAAGMFAPGATAPRSPSGVALARGAAVVPTGASGEAQTGEIVDLRPGFAVHEVGPSVTGLLALAAARIDGDALADAIVGVATGAQVHLARRDGTLAHDGAGGSAFGPRVQALALADVDRDGAIDAVLAAGGQSAIWRNGSGGAQRGRFTSSSPLNGIGEGRAIAVGDLDDDGWVDLAIADDLGCTVAINGSSASPGAFSTLRVVAGSMRAIGLADLDRDGDLDAVVGGDTGAIVLRNEGGALTPLLTFAKACSALALGDVDADGRMDIVLAGPIGGRAELRVQRGLGGLTFAESAYGLEVADVTALVLGDFDGDPWPDLVVGGSGPGLVLGNDGMGGFAVVGQRLLPIGCARHLLLVDLDADGDNDLLSGGEQQPLRAWSFMRPIGLSFRGRPLSAIAATNGVALGDVDGDGRLDLLLANGSGEIGDDSEADLCYAFDAAAGAFAALPIALPKPTFVPPGGGAPLRGVSFATALADVDGDGDLDVVFARQSSQFVAARGFRLWHNDGGGGLGEPVDVDLEPNGSLSLALGDVDADGQPDLLASRSGGAGGATLFHGRRQPPHFGPGPRPAVSTAYAYHFALGDVDADGDIDIVCGTRDGIQLAVNAGDGQSFAIFAVVNGVDPDGACLALADFDRDGDLDIVASEDLGAGVHRIRIASNNGAGSFQLGPAMPIDARPDDLEHGDFDADGREDLVLATSLGARLWRGDGLGGFTPSGFDFGVGDARALAVGDIDGNGRLDLVVGNHGAPTVVWFGN